MFLVGEVSQTVEHWTVIDGSWPEVFFVPGDNDGQYPNSNSMLVKTARASNAAILIDCGIGTRVARKLRKEVTITRVLLSHWHEDHTSSLRAIKGAIVSCHPLDIPPLVDAASFKRAYGVDGTAIEQKFTDFIDALGMEPLGEVEPLRAGTFKAGDAALEVIHAPGHSAGHCCFYEPRRKIAFLGDIDLSRFGPWYGCLDSNLEDFVRSIRAIRNIDIDIAVSGHDGIKEGKAIKVGLDHFLKKVDERDARILALMHERSPANQADLIGHNVVYRNYDMFGDYYRIAESIMIGHHLRRLLMAGEIIRHGGGYTLS